VTDVTDAIKNRRCHLKRCTSGLREWLTVTRKHLLEYLSIIIHTTQTYLVCYISWRLVAGKIFKKKSNHKHADLNQPDVNSRTSTFLIVDDLETKLDDVDNRPNLQQVISLESVLVRKKQEVVVQFIAVLWIRQKTNRQTTNILLLFIVLEILVVVDFTCSISCQCPTSLKSHKL
jgi:hypothetical protein